jgi:hypothetical protein
MTTQAAAIFDAFTATLQPGIRKAKADGVNDAAGDAGQQDDEDDAFAALLDKYSDKPARASGGAAAPSTDVYAALAAKKADDAAKLRRQQEQREEMERAYHEEEEADIVSAQCFTSFLCSCSVLLQILITFLCLDLLCSIGSSWLAPSTSTPLQLRRDQSRSAATCWMRTKRRKQKQCLLLLYHLLPLKPRTPRPRLRHPKPSMPARASKPSQSRRLHPWTQLQPMLLPLCLKPVFLLAPWINPAWWQSQSVNLSRWTTPMLLLLQMLLKCP